MSKSTIDYTNEKFLITNEPVMMLAMDVLQVLNKIGKITIIGKGELCPITQRILNGLTKTEKISVDSEILDDGRLISTLEIMIIKNSI